MNPLASTPVVGKSTEEFSEPICILIPEGWFLMGCAQGRDDEKPVRRIWVDAFQMATLQVRNRDWAVFSAATGHPSPPYWDHSDFNDPDQPVVAVTWYEAEKYCEWLSRVWGRRYRLPTEAEWEKAARGGRKNELYPWGNSPPEDSPQYRARWSGEVKGPLPVGQGSPNPYGLYDISENVHEWCADWYEKDYYLASPERNPQGPATGTRRASRGGAWRHHIKASRSASRSSIPPEFEYADYGFRVARDLR
jgi:formylglycine-generating enzyme required for sulfatase activity